MSHYCVAVITDINKSASVENLLKPYDENIQVAPYIYKTKQEIIDEAKNKCTKLENDIKAYVSNSDEYLKNYNVYWLTDYKVNPRQLSDYYLKVLSYKNMTDNEIYENSIDENTYYDKNGNELSTYNPNSKWDWYEIGGRFSGYIKKIDSSNCDSCYVADMDIRKNEDVYRKAIRFWEVVVEEKPLKDNEDKSNFDTWYKKDYYKERYLSKEIFANSVSSENIFYAIVTPDGVWHEPGKMGYFGVSLADYEKQREWDTNCFKDYIEPYFDHNHIITIVDCHI